VIEGKPESYIKDHANCGTGELARAAMPAVLPKGRARVKFAAALANPGQVKTMDGTLRIVTMLALVAVVVVLLAGLWNMMRGTSPNLSQTLMRWRVGLQFLAIVIAMVLVYFLRP
jgi:hypothetical protein